MTLMKAFSNSSPTKISLGLEEEETPEKLGRSWEASNDKHYYQLLISKL